MEVILANREGLALGNDNFPDTVKLSKMAEVVDATDHLGPPHTASQVSTTVIVN